MQTKGQQINRQTGASGDELGSQWNQATALAIELTETAQLADLPLLDDDAEAIAGGDTIGCNCNLGNSNHNETLDEDDNPEDDALELTDLPVLDDDAEAITGGDTFVNQGSGGWLGNHNETLVDDLIRKASLQKNIAQT